MRPSSARLTFAGFVACACVRLFAQGAAPATTQQPPIRTGVNLVRVDVYPTRDGKPVTDLRAEDFEVFEDGAQQRIETFEHVVALPAGPQSARVEPGSQRESLQAAANPRTRVFVIFLDTPNVSVANAYIVEEPLIRLIDRLLGPDDLVGVMTPAMSASQVVLGRKTQVIEEGLQQAWPWGTRHTTLLDDRETAYDICYRGSPLAAEMIARKRERATFEALQDLIRYLYAIREERKAILTVTEGWVRYRENRDLMRPYDGGPPGLDPITVGPNGKPTTRDPRNDLAPLSMTECDTDRMRLASMDNEEFFRDLVNDANRANVSFYPIDPRGLAAFESPMVPRSDDEPRIHADRQNLRIRHGSIEDLAAGTDGLAVMNTNDFDRGLKRISDDLASYYLLGYYSTNTKMDGTFRSLRVRVKEPGIDVRARRGYRAATVAEAASARRAMDPPSPSASGFTAALASLDRIRLDTRFRINAATAGTSGIVWVAGEVLADGRGAANLSRESTVDIEVAGDQSSASARVTLEPGRRTFLTSVALASTGGALDVRARFAAEGDSVLTDNVRLETGPAVTRPLLFRRGPTTANRVLPAADFRFRRSERVRVEVPVPAGATAGPATLLDRAGNALQVPVTTGERRDEGTNQAWITADVALAPLAPGDYAIEVAWTTGGSEQRTFAAIRLTR
ncbi:MAG TPA: VWA domain-containing protein [Vicinamibacterales bacterium]|nr:VWA domain-containing protein [Vicinamibacterales bacterium]